MSPERSLLVVAASADRRATVVEGLESDRTAVEAVPPSDVTAVVEASPDCVVVDADDPSRVGDLVGDVGRRVPKAPCVVTAVEGDESTAAAATRAGADDYVPRPAPDATDRLHERVAAMVDEALAHQTALRELNRATRDLMLADSETAVCEVTVETAEEVLGLSVSTVFLYDESREALVPEAWTDDAADLFGDIPALDPGESLGWETFRSGELTVSDDLTDTDRVQSPETPARSELQVPLGEHGLLATGATRPRAFDEFDVELARSLAATAEAALRRTARERSLREYRTVFETVQDQVYVLDEDSRFRLVTDPLCDLLGYDREDLLGEHIAEFVVEDGISDRVRSEIGTMATDADDDREVLTVEATVYDAEGETVPVEADIVPFPPESATFEGSVGVVHDVSERKRVEQQLSVERTRLQRLLDTLPDAVAYAEFRDGDPIVQSVNASFEETFGHDEEALVGESLNDYIVPPEQADEAERIDEVAVGGEFPKTEVRRRTADGIRHFLFRGVPIDGPGSTPEGFGIYTDITEQKTRQQRLQVLNRVLRHNLRNEMNVVVGNADLIAEADVSNLDVDVTARAREITETATDVAEIGERVRQLERALDRSGVGTIDVATLASTVADRYRDRTGVTVTTTLPNRLAVQAGDLLEVALADLVENAVEHTAHPTTVSIDGCRDGEWIELSVADDGPGIPEAEIAAIEDDTDTSQLSHGSGLGLWLVDWLTTSLGGEVRFSEPEGRGSVVTLRLPAAGPGAA